MSRNDGKGYDQMEKNNNSKIEEDIIQIKETPIQYEQRDPDSTPSSEPKRADVPSSSKGGGHDPSRHFAPRDVWLREPAVIQMFDDRVVREIMLPFGLPSARDLQLSAPQTHALYRDRVEAYIEHLTALGLPLPADPVHPTWLSIECVGAEAGISRDALADPRGEIRRILAEAQPSLGLCPIITRSAPPASMTPLTLLEAEGLVSLRVQEEASATGERVRRRLQEYAKIFTLCRNRTTGPEQFARPALETLEADLVAGNLRRGAVDASRIREISSILGGIEADRGAEAKRRADCAVSDDGLPTRACEALTQIAAGIGIPYARLAELVGVNQATLRHWMMGEHVPEIRHLDVIEKICEIAGRPAGPLNHRFAAERLQRDRLDESYFPEHLRGAENARLRAALVARACLPRDWTRSADTSTTRDFFEELYQSYRRSTTEGRILQTIRASSPREDLPTAFLAELRACCAARPGVSRDDHGTRDGARPSSIEKYVATGSLFAAFITSDRCDPAYRVERRALSMVHLCSPALWRLFFAEKAERAARIRAVEEQALQSGRDATVAVVRKTSVPLSRSTIEHMGFAVSLLAPVDGYVTSSAQRRAELAALPLHLLDLSSPLTDMTVVHEVRRRMQDVYGELKKAARPAKPGRVTYGALLDLPDPMEPIRRTMSRLVGDLGRLREGSRTWAWKLRSLVAVGILAQTGLRSHLMVTLTIDGDKRDLIRDEDHYRLEIDACRFKNSSTIAYRSGRYSRVLKYMEKFDFTKYLDMYIKIGRHVFTKGQQSEYLLVTAGEKGLDGMGSEEFRRMIKHQTTVSFGRLAKPEDRIAGISHLTAHGFRDVLATSVLKATGGDFTRAAAAIHVTEAVARQHYARSCIDDIADELSEGLERALNGDADPHRRPLLRFVRTVKSKTMRRRYRRGE